MQTDWSFVQILSVSGVCSVTLHHLGKTNKIENIKESCPVCWDISDNYLGYSAIFIPHFSGTWITTKHLETFKFQRKQILFNLTDYYVLKQHGR